MRASGNAKAPRQIQRLTRELFPSAETVVRSEVDRLMAIVNAAVPTMVERRMQELDDWARDFREHCTQSPRDELAVVYSKAHLRRCRMPPTSALWLKRGRIVGRDGRWLLVLWAGADEPVPVAPEALCNPQDAAASDCKELE